MNINYSKNIANSIFYFLDSRFYCRFCIVVLFSIFYFLFSFNPAEAARFFVVPPELVVDQEQEIILGVDTEEDIINAVEIKLNFSPEDFVIKNISEGSSIISFWLDVPSFSNDKGEIFLSGIIVGGYKGDDGRLLKINLIPRKTNENGFNISQANVLLNDGKGTEAEINPSFLKFQIIKNGAPSEIPSMPAAKDSELPEPFIPEISNHPDVFSGKWFLVFNSQDKNSGIDYYQIREARQKILLPFVKWEKAQSPYVLKDQELKSFICVKAVDCAGNTRLAVLNPKQPLKWYENYLFWAIIIILLIILVVIWIIPKFLWGKYIKKH